MRRTRASEPCAWRWRRSALVTASCSLVGGDDDGGDDEQARRAGHPRVVRDLPKELKKQFEEETRLRPGGEGLRRRRRAHQQAGAHQGRPDRRRGVRHRQHLRVARHRRGRARAVRRRRCPTARTTYALAGRRRPRPHPGRQRQRLRQRRRHLVRRQGRPAAADARRPDQARRTRTSSSRPARPRARPGWRSCWPRSRRTARTAGRTTGAS